MKILVIDAAYCVHKDVETTGIGTLIIYENLLETKNNISILSDKSLVNCGKNEIVNYIVNNKYKVICFSTRGDTYPFVLLMSKKLKSKIPDIKIIIGGPQATLSAKKTMEKYPSIDLVVKGPGEKLIQSVITSGFDPKKLARINNIVYRNNDLICETEYKKNSCEVKFPIVGFRKYNNKQYIDEIYVEAGRGCTYNCTYCVTNKVWDKTYFIREPKEILKEIVAVKEVIDFKKVSFVHDNILSNKKLGKKFLNEMNKAFPKNLKWTASVRIDLLNNEMIKLLKKAGCSDIYIGLETGSEKMQKKYNKYINLDKAVDNFINLEKSGINFTVSLIIGHPEEDLDDLFETIYIAIFLKGLNHCSCVQFHKLAFVYGSALYEKYKNSIVFKKVEISDQANIILEKDEELMVENDKDIFSTFYSYDGPMLMDNVFLKRENLEIIVNTYYRCLNTIMEEIELEDFKKSIIKLLDDRDAFIDWIKSYKNIISEYFDDCLELENLVYELMTKSKFEFNDLGINKTAKFIKNNSFKLIIWKTKGNVVLYEKITKEKDNILNSIAEEKVIKSKKKQRVINNWKNNFLIK